MASYAVDMYRVNQIAFNNSKRRKITDSVTQMEKVERNQFLPVCSDDYLHSKKAISVLSKPTGISNDCRRWSLLDDPADPACARAQALHLTWREAECKVPHGAWMISFDENTVIEQFRISSIEAVFNYVLRENLAQSTLHLAVQYINRLFYHHLVERKSSTVSIQMLASSVVAATRTAVKLQERWEKSEKFRIAPLFLWNASGFCAKQSADKSLELLNKMETAHLQLLENIVHAPVVSDFLEQYLMVGGWPEYVDTYRNLSTYLLALSVFVSGKANPLRGVPPSKLAAAALMLSVKIMNADMHHVAYEAWTEKLAAFTLYKLEEIQPIVHSLSRLLRKKHDKVNNPGFVGMFPEWARYSWT